MTIPNTPLPEATRKRIEREADEYCEDNYGIPKDWEPMMSMTEKEFQAKIIWAARNAATAEATRSLVLVEALENMVKLSDRWGKEWFNKEDLSQIEAAKKSLTDYNNPLP